MTDTVALQFINPITGSVVGTDIGNSTSIHLEKDFFVPSNSLTFQIEDDRIGQFQSFLQIGWIVQLFINGKLNMIGYIFNYHLTYSKSSGTSLTVQCKDLLEYMAQSTVYPNFGINSNYNVHFQPTDSIQYCLRTIAQSFWNETQIGTGASNIRIITDNNENLTVASGFQSGLKIHGKSTAKSIASAQNHLTTPYKGESHLAYMLRLAKLAGACIKMSNITPYTILVSSPTYKRQDAGSPFAIYHCQSAPNNQSNNTIEASISYNFDHQPSVVIIEANTTGDGSFHLATAKGVILNALTAVDDRGTVLPTVSLAIANLTTGHLGASYQRADFNQDLFNQRSSMGVNLSTSFSLPYYSVSSNAHSAEEAKFAAEEYLAECQDKYVEMTYKVAGWTMPGTGYVWQPDMMVNVVDDILFPNSAQKPFQMWIKKVEFTRSRHEGTISVLTLSLPYTHTSTTKS